MKYDGHTPGPWRIEATRYIYALKEKPVCEIPSGGLMHNKVDEANAQLIADAPMLAEQNAKMLALIKTFQEHCSNPTQVNELVGGHETCELIAEIEAES